MKRILSLLLALTLIFSLVACNNEKNTSSDINTSTDNTTQSDTESTDDTSTESSENDTTDENSSDTETPSNSTPTSTETNKPTTNNKDNTTSSKPSNITNTPTTSKPTTSSTPSETETTEIIYYDMSRKTKSSLSKEKVNSFLEELESSMRPAKVKEKNGEKVNYYHINDIMAYFSHFDILGYNFTKEELLQAGGLYNRNGFFYDRIDENNETYVTFPTSYSHTIYLKTKEEAFNALKSDIATFFEYMGDSHDIRITHFGYPYDGIPTVEVYNATVEDYTDEMIRETAFDRKSILNLSSLRDDCPNKNDFCGSFEFTCWEDREGTVEYVFSMDF